MYKLYLIILLSIHLILKGDFSGKGDSGEVIIDLDKDAEDIEEISSKADSVGTYSLEYLNPVVKAVGQ